MGSFIYGTHAPIPVEDRALVHLQLVIYSKLRAQESFPFSWKDEPGVGDGHGSVWIAPGIPLVFKYAGGRDPAVNREWLRVLRVPAYARRKRHRGTGTQSALFAQEADG